MLFVDLNTILAVDWIWLACIHRLYRLNGIALDIKYKP